MISENECTTSTITKDNSYPGRLLRTRGCMILLCMSGYAVVEVNFRRYAFRRGCISVFFSDTLFSIEKRSESLDIICYELDLSVSDEVTHISSSAFFDWIFDNPVITLSSGDVKELCNWIAGTDWIITNTSGKDRAMMIRNHFQNFFLGLESTLKPSLSCSDARTISSPRRLFNRFCQLLSENCQSHHDVKFYADSLCITPYYLSRVTDRIFQVSPKELIDRQIILEVKAMLTTTHLSVKEISDRFSFDNPSYFVRYFRRHTGMTPLSYRDRMTVRLKVR